MTRIGAEFLQPIKSLRVSPIVILDLCPLFWKRRTYMTNPHAFLALTERSNWIPKTENGMYGTRCQQMDREPGVTADSRS